MGEVRTGRLSDLALKKETTAGTYITPDKAYRFTTEGLIPQTEFAEDDSNVGEIYTQEKILTKAAAGGAVESKMHPDMIGIQLHGVLGGESAVADPAEGYLFISYNGTSLYARVTKSGTDMTFEDSSDGSSWAVDTNIGVSGVIDLTDSANDTLAELQAVIDAATGWQATYVGNGSSSYTNIADFAATNVFENDKHIGCKIVPYAISASTTAKTHFIYPADSDTTLPSYTFQGNRVLGTNKSIAWTGMKFATVGLAVNASEICTVSCTMNGRRELVDQNDVSLAIPTPQAYIAPNATILLIKSDGTQVDYDEMKDFSTTLNSNPDDNFNIGSLYKEEQIRQNSTLDVSFTCNNTDSQYTVRTEYLADSYVEVLVYYESNSNADVTNSIPYSVLNRIPRLKLEDYNSPTSSGDRYVITGAGTVEKPQSTTNPKHIYYYIVDQETTTY